MQHREGNITSKAGEEGSGTSEMIKGAETAGKPQKQRSCGAFVDDRCTHRTGGDCMRP